MWRKLLSLFHGKISVSGLEAPSDFYMPKVDADLARDEQAFAIAREMSAGRSASPDQEPNKRCVAVITPARLIMPIPIPPAEAVSAEMLASVRGIIPTQPRQAITVIAFNDVIKQGAVTPRQVNSLIPVLGHLTAMAFDGHTVVVFEGHPSGFEAGVRNSDVLIIDSAMLPYLQNNWGTVAFGAMREGARILIHDRKSYTLLPVARAKCESGWRYAEPDGEASYANCLLTTMAKAPKRAVHIAVGSPLPDLAQIATDLGELEWISTLPFKYGQLDADQIVDILVRLAKPDPRGSLGRSLTLTAKLATSGGQMRDVSFKLTEVRTSDGRRQLDIEPG
jgi:hypothetical protein